METRFAGLGQTRAVIVALLLVMALVGAAWSVRGALGPKLRSDVTAQSDPDLYRSVVAGVENGGDFYPVTAQALRKGHYPLRPFVTFRLPTLAWISAVLGSGALHLLQLALGGAVMLAWGLRWRGTLAPIELVAALVLLGAGLIGLVQPAAALFHESWAAMLLALAIAHDRKGRAALAIVAGTAALLIRELSLPLILALAGLSVVEHRRREAFGWAAAVALFAVALILHAGAVSAVVLPTDLHSPGWSGLLGPGFAIRSLAQTSAATVLPPVPVALLLTLALFGLASLRTGWALRASLMVVGYLAMVALFARADTFYWAMMAAPLSLVGLAFVPRAARDLAAALRPVAVTGA